LNNVYYYFNTTKGGYMLKMAQGCRDREIVGEEIDVEGRCKDRGA
jgi:hypothetical protein